MEHRFCQNNFGCCRLLLLLWARNTRKTPMLWRMKRLQRRLLRWPLALNRGLKIYHGSKKYHGSRRRYWTMIQTNSLAKSPNEAQAYWGLGWRIWNAREEYRLISCFLYSDFLLYTCSHVAICPCISWDFAALGLTFANLHFSESHSAGLRLTITTCAWGQKKDNFC